MSAPRLQQLSLAVILVALAPPPSVLSFVPTTAPPSALSDGRGLRECRQHQHRHHHRQRNPETSLRGASKQLQLRRRSSRQGPQPLLASAKPDVKDTSCIISDMEEWARIVSPENAYIKRNFTYMVSAGTSLPEVFFDFWKAVSNAVDEHRATGQDRSFRKVVMFVAPFCEELRDYATMERAHQLLEQSARDGGCEDLGNTITHLHYHPNYRHRPSPKQMRMASRHSPHPAFCIEALYRTGGLKSLASMRAKAQTQGTHTPPPPPQPAAELPEEVAKERAKKKMEWVLSTRSSLESTYSTAASYGAEDAVTGTSSSPHAFGGGRGGVPESSQEIMHATQAWLKGALQDAAESDNAAAAAAASLASKNAKDRKETTPPLCMASLLSTPPAVAPDGRDGFPDRSTAFSPPTAAEAAAAAQAAMDEEAQISGLQDPTIGAGSAHSNSVSPTRKGSTPPRNMATGSLKQAFAHPAERVTVRRDAPQTSGGNGGFIAEQVEAYDEEDDDGLVAIGGWGSGDGTMPGKELIKRMKEISQFIVARSKTAEEAYGDVWEVVMEMAGRAANRGCSVPTDDYSSSSSPCYGALMVMPDLATYNSDAFFKFQETLNRGLKHLPMEHDISLEAFHPEAVSEATPLDHRFTRSPYPTLHLIYHGVRTEDTRRHPRAVSSSFSSPAAAAAVGAAAKTRATQKKGPTTTAGSPAAAASPRARRSRDASSSTTMRRARRSRASVDASRRGDGVDSTAGEGSPRDTTRDNDKSESIGGSGERKHFEMRGGEGVRARARAERRRDNTGASGSNPSSSGNPGSVDAGDVDGAGERRRV